MENSIDAVGAKFFEPEQLPLFESWRAAIEASEWLCVTRVWSAWSVGTMSREDFVPVAENADVLTDVLYAYFAASDPAEAIVAAHAVLSHDIGRFEGGIADDFNQESFDGMELEDAMALFTLIEPVHRQRWLQVGVPSTQAPSTRPRM